MFRSFIESHFMRARKTCLLGLSFFVALQLLLSCMPRARAQEVFNPATDVFFEYGAESGILRPPFDHAGSMGSGDHSGSYAAVVGNVARSRARSVMLYQKPPPKSDAQRRVEMRKYDTKQEYYMSWWALFPDTFPSGEWKAIASQTLRYGVPGDTWKYKNSWGFTLTGGPPRKIRIRVDNIYRSQHDEWDTGFVLNSTYLNTWIHFELYTKMGANFAGVHKAWINGILVKELTGVTNDPRSDLSRWDSEQCYFVYHDEFFMSIKLYNDRDEPECWYYFDDVVLSHTYVPSSYHVGSHSLGFESWEDGFESGNFSAWDGTQVRDPERAWANVTSTYSYEGSYSANFTTDGSLDSYARAMHIVQDSPWVFIRSYVRFEDLPDTNGSIIWFHRIASESGRWVSTAGVEKINGSYNWITRAADGTTNRTQDVINPDTWYCVEYHFNATTNGNATLWVNNVKKCEMTGDFSGYTIARVYPYIYISGEAGQASPKTVYHDDFRVDDERMSKGASTVFRTSLYTSELGEQALLENVKINGTRLTNALGCYEWENLAYNTVHTFVIEKPASYYAAWVLNVEGSYDWNGTHYILRHNVTKTQTGPIEIYFSSNEEAYIKSSTHKLASVSSYSSSQNPHSFMSLNISADIGDSSRIEIYTADEGHPRPFKIEGATDWSYDSKNEILTVWMLHTGEEEAEIEWRGAAMGQ